MNFEKHFKTLLNLHMRPLYTCAFDLLHAQSFDYQSSGFLGYDKIKEPQLKL